MLLLRQSGTNQSPCDSNSLRLLSTCEISRPRSPRHGSFQRRHDITTTFSAIPGTLTLEFLEFLELITRIQSYLRGRSKHRQQWQPYEPRRRASLAPPARFSLLLLLLDRMPRNQLHQQRMPQRRHFTYIGGRPRIRRKSQRCRRIPWI